MQGKSKELSRRHLVVGAVGSLVLPVATHAAARGIEEPTTEADARFMRMAIAEAALGDYPFGTVIVRDGDVLARGRNLGNQERDPTAHGEMVAIRNFLKEHGSRFTQTDNALHFRRILPNVHGGDHLVRDRPRRIWCLDCSACDQDRADHGHQQRDRQQDVVP